MGALTGFTTEPWELAAAAGLTHEVGTELRSGLRRLELDVDALLAGWQGAAGRSFADGWSQWRAGASDVLAALEAMGQLLAATGRGYEGAESASVSAFG